MATTKLRLRIAAPREAVYRALLDAGDVATWMVPTGMTSHVHVFEPREGGAFRISLTYDAPIGAGKTTAQSDTFHGRFVKLVPDELVVEMIEFETADPTMQGEMRVTLALHDVDGATEIEAVHDYVPPGVPPDQNELGWSISLGKLRDLVERRYVT